MKKVYGSLDEVNRSYNSKYSSFEEIKAQNFEKSMRAGTYSLWLDYRLFMEEEFVTLATEDIMVANITYERAEELAEEMAPTADAVKKYREAARKGSAEAQYQFARCLEFGFHVKKPNRAAARELYERAARQGHAKAAEVLGWKPQRKRG